MDEEEEVPEKKVPEELTCPDWMMTMGDAMSLLLTFFVLLLTFSTTSKSRLMDVIGVMKGAFSFIETTNLLNREETAFNDNTYEKEEGPITNPKDATSIRLTSNSIQRKFKDMSETLSEVGFKNPLQLKKLDQGYSIEVAVDDIFEKDSTTLTSGGLKLIQEVANIAFNVNNEIRIMSFMKPEDMQGSKLGDAWMTSTQRGIKISELLSDRFNIDQSRFAVGTDVAQSAEADSEYSKIKIVFVEGLNVRKVSVQDLLKDTSQ
jgi:chemotaxis protein MotB